jgi:type I restriction enzyme M protein
VPRLRSFYKVDPKQWQLIPKNSKLSEPDTQKEFTRQWMLQELIQTYQFPIEWIARRVTFINNDSDEFEKDFFGFYLKTLHGNQPFLLVSIAEVDKASEAEKVLSSLLLPQFITGLGVCTDGTEKGTRFIRKRFDSNKCEYITDFEPYLLPSQAPGSQPYLAGLTTITSKGRNLTPLSERIENIFFEAHSHIRDIDGLHSDEALDELCKVLYTKMYDEEFSENLKPYRMQRWLYGSTEEMAASIRETYKEANEYDTRVFSLKIPGYQRSRGVFNAPIRLSSPALVKVVETLQEHSITQSDTDIKGRAFQKVIGPTIRAGMGQYFTPQAVVRFMVNVVCPRVSELILDPFCGSAHFLTSCLQYVKKSSKSSDKSLHEFAFGKLHGIEKSDRMVRVAMTDMRLQGDGHSNIRCTDSLLDLQNYPDLQSESFDLVLTNPPFGSLLGSEALSQLGSYILIQGRKTIPLEILGVERSIQFLRPGGRLGIVLPDSFLDGKKSKYVREWLQTQVKLRAVISLPIETFPPFGASIKTSIIFLRKWRKGETKKTDYSIFLGRVDNIGYEATGRFREGAELEKIEEELLAFFEEEGW